MIQLIDHVKLPWVTRNRFYTPTTPALAEALAGQGTRSSLLAPPFPWRSPALPHPKVPTFGPCKGCSLPIPRQGLSLNPKLGFDTGPGDPNSGSHDFTSILTL